MKSSNYQMEASSAPKVSKITKAEYEAAMARAQKIRGNRQIITTPVPKYVMVDGVPHISKGGKLVSLKKIS